MKNKGLLKTTIDQGDSLKLDLVRRMFLYDLRCISVLLLSYCICRRHNFNGNMAKEKHGNINANMFPAKVQKLPENIAVLFAITFRSYKVLCKVLYQMTSKRIPINYNNASVEFRVFLLIT